MYRPYTQGTFPFLSFPIIFLLTSTGRTGEPVSMVEGSNDAFATKCLFGFSLKRFEFTTTLTPKIRLKEAYLYNREFIKRGNFIRWHKLPYS
jgi:hypothetical protein